MNIDREHVEGLLDLLRQVMITNDAKAKEIAALARDLATARSRIDRLERAEYERVCDAERVHS